MHNLPMQLVPFLGMLLAIPEPKRVCYAVSKLTPHVSIQKPFMYS